MNKWCIYDHPELKEWIHVFEYVFQRGQVGYKNGIRFCIHTAENGHNKPHLHASYQGEGIVIEIPTGTVLEGNLSNKQKKVASTWVSENAEYLEEKWNELVDGVCLFG